MQRFINVLNNQDVLYVDRFIIASFDLFRSSLKDRINCSSRIFVNDAYTLVMLLSYILKVFISKEAHFFF